MDYIAHLFLNHLCHVEEEIRFANGKKQVCLIIPTESNQMKKGKWGNWLMPITFRECPPNPEMISHTAQLVFRNKDEVHKARDQGYFDKTQRIGRMRVIAKNPEKKLDLTNHAAEIRCDGMLTLNDIPRRYIIVNKINGKRYVENLEFRPANKSDVVYTGALCLDEIPQENIQIDPDTGKRRVYLRFVKRKFLDVYMNTHQLVIVTPEGFEIEVGQFREWKRADGKESSSDNIPNGDSPNPGYRQDPESIDGFRF